MKISYLWAKLTKKIRGSAMLQTCFAEDSKAEAGCHLIDVSMGRHSFCGYDCEIYRCKIGSFCSIGNYVRIGGSKHPYEWVSTSPVFYKGRDSVKKKFVEYEREADLETRIGHDVWLGEGCYIKAGVEIGNGAVVGMGCVVTKDVEPYAIVAGNPARFIRYRFEKEICDLLNDTEWWSLPEEDIQMLAPYIKEPILFIEQYRKIKSSI